MDKWDQSAEELFGVVLDLAPERRAAFLDQACQDAPELRQLVEELLLENDRAGSFLAASYDAGYLATGQWLRDKQPASPRDDGQSLLHRRASRVRGNGRDL
jgi:hypothetical protein